MFGFLAPGRRIPEWRQNYARVCQFQRQLFGLTSLPFLSFEATFLYQLAVDYRLLPMLPSGAPECCRLRKIRHSDPKHDEAAASFAASFGLLLAGVKLQDDVQDSGRWYNRLLLWKYRGRIRKARQMIRSVAPEVPALVDAAITRHAALEAAATPATIEEYSAPTGDGFAAVFDGFLNCVGENSTADCRADFKEIGQQVGRAIIAWDCAVDFEKDGLRGEFNPLQTEDEVQAAFDECLLCLARMGWLLPPESVSRQVIAGVAVRVRLRRRKKTCAAPARRLERWGILREKGFAYARCDGCDALCAVGECCECIGGAGEAASGCGECAACCNAPHGCAFPCPCECCECCALCGDEGPCKEKQKKEKADRTSGSEPPNPYSEFVGRTGTAETQLNPSGHVLIDGARLPAKSASVTYIEPGTAVRVIRSDPFGVTVVEI